MRCAPAALLALALAACAPPATVTPDAAASDAGDVDADTLHVARAALDARCETCHAEIAAEWRGTLHAHAMDDPLFVAERAYDHGAWCVRCHGPLADARAPASGAERGVGCLTCHAPHDGRVHDEAIATRDCAACHDAPMPSAPDVARPHAPGDRLQRTDEEWRHSAAFARGDGCTTCHFPVVTGADGTTHASHALPGAHDDALWRDAIAVRASVTRGALRVELRVRGAGHAVPTGDRYRRLVVTALPEDAEPVSTELRRRFGPTPLGTAELADDRVPADGSPRVVVLPLPRGTRRTSWTVAWQARADGERRVVASGVAR